MANTMPDVSSKGHINVKEDSSIQQRLLTTSSSFECTFRRDMRQLLTLSTVTRSKFTPVHYLPRETPAPLDPVLSTGITLSTVNGKVMVHATDSASELATNLAMILLNGSEIVDLPITLNGKDMNYFVRNDIGQASHDLRSLGIHSTLVTYENGVIVYVHRLVQGRQSAVDVRISSKHSVINVRYGISVAHEKKRILQHAFLRAVSLAWQREKYFLLHSFPSSYNWSASESIEILARGSATGYKGQYILTAETYPELAGDCNNIRLVRQTAK